jgi:hypothetical protein
LATEDLARRWIEDTLPTAQLPDWVHRRCARGEGRVDHHFAARMVEVEGRVGVAALVQCRADGRVRQGRSAERVSFAAVALGVGAVVARLAHLAAEDPEGSGWPST